MFEKINSLVKITCDKCGVFDTARDINHGEIFHSLGWGLSTNARKYKHRCASCLVKAGFKSYKKYLHKASNPEVGHSIDVNGNCNKGCC